MLIQKEFILSIIFICLMSDKFYKLMMHWHKAGFVFWSCVKSACSKGFWRLGGLCHGTKKTPQSFEKVCIPRRAHNLWSIWLPSNHQTLWLGYIIFHLTISPYLVLFDKEPSMTLCFADKAIDVAAFFRTSPYHPLLTIGARRRAIYKHQCLGRSTQTVLPASRHEKKKQKIETSSFYMTSTLATIHTLGGGQYVQQLIFWWIMGIWIWSHRSGCLTHQHHRNSASLRTDLTRSLIGFRELLESSLNNGFTNIFLVHLQQAIAKLPQ